MKRSLLLLLSLITIAVAGCGDDKNAVPTNNGAGGVGGSGGTAGQFEGKWKIVKVTHDGVNQPSNPGLGAYLVITGTKFKAYNSDNSPDGEGTINGNTMTIDKTKFTLNSVNANRFTMSFTDGGIVVEVTFDKF